MAVLVLSGDTTTHWPHILINPINHMLCQLFNRYLKFFIAQSKRGKNWQNCIENGVKLGGNEQKKDIKPEIASVWLLDFNALLYCIDLT